MTDTKPQSVKQAVQDEAKRREKLMHMAKKTLEPLLETLSALKEEGYPVHLQMEVDCSTPDSQRLTGTLQAPNILNFGDEEFPIYDLKIDFTPKFGSLSLVIQSTLDYDFDWREADSDETEISMINLSPEALDNLAKRFYSTVVEMEIQKSEPPTLKI